VLDLFVIELAADVEFHGRETDVTVRELVVFGAEHALANRTKRFDGRRAIDAVALIGEGHRTSL
jgi:hypothetical protein